jgi:hypothetical protein
MKRQFSRVIIATVSLYWAGHPRFTFVLLGWPVRPDDGNGRTATETRSELGARFDRLMALNSNAAPTLAAVFQALPGASFIVNGAACT